MNNKKYVLFLDMDGVICNFGKAIKNIGVSFDELNDSDPVGSWAKIDNAGVEFWSEMEWMPDGKKLWDYVKKYRPNILSSPGKHTNGEKGKLEWIKRELGDDVGDIYLVPKKLKQEYALDHNYILIDDHPGNIWRWKKAGGHGIEHPFNSDKTIEKLKKLGL